MILVGTFLVLILIVATIGVTVLRHHLKEVTRARERVEQSWWDRRNRLPLFFELVRRAGLSSNKNLTQALTIRSALSSKHSIGFTQTDEQEAHLGGLIAVLSTTIRQTASLKTQTLLQAVVNELELITQQLGHDRAHYTVSFQKLASLYQKPIAGKCAKMFYKSHFEPLFMQK